MAGPVGRNERRPSRWFAAAAILLLGILVLSGCGSGGSAVNAAINTAAALGAAGYERSQGRCYSNCVPGTTCNEETGYCDPVPCAGRCRPGEICRETADGERCDPWGEIEMQPTSDAP
jgi:hypothetical protein